MASSPSPEPYDWDKVETQPEESVWDRLDQSAPAPEAEVEPERPAEAPADEADDDDRYPLSSLQDVIFSSEVVLEDYRKRRVDDDFVTAFSKLSQVVIAAKKAEAAVGGEEKVPLDLSKIPPKPDIEAMRPTFVEAMNFAGMTDEEKQDLFQRTRRQNIIDANRNGGSNGNGNGE